MVSLSCKGAVNLAQISYTNARFHLNNYGASVQFLINIYIYMQNVFELYVAIKRRFFEVWTNVHCPLKMEKLVWFPSHFGSHAQDDYAEKQALTTMMFSVFQIT